MATVQNLGYDGMDEAINRILKGQEMLKKKEINTQDNFYTNSDPQQKKSQ